MARDADSGMTTYPDLSSFFMRYVYPALTTYLCALRYGEFLAQR
jgi:hypothetical protein